MKLEASRVLSVTIASAMHKEPRKPGAGRKEKSTSQKRVVDVGHAGQLTERAPCAQNLTAPISQPLGKVLRRLGNILLPHWHWEICEVGACASVPLAVRVAEQHRDHQED